MSKPKFKLQDYQPHYHYVMQCDTFKEAYIFIRYLYSMNTQSVPIEYMDNEFLYQSWLQNGEVLYIPLVTLPHSQAVDTHKTLLKFSDFRWKEPEKYSYSKLSTYAQCPHQFKFKYEDKHYSSQSSLAMELGGLVHKGLELATIDIMSGHVPNYAELIEQIQHVGFTEPNKYKPDEGDKEILCINKLKQKYLYEWHTPDKKTGALYENKLLTFFENYAKLHLRLENWEPIAVEYQFDVPYGDFILTGYIDRVDRHRETGKLRVVDYKTSNAVYKHKDLTTPLQMAIYDYVLAKQYEDPEIVQEHLYDFVLLGEEQVACTKGFRKRAQTKLNKIFAGIVSDRESGEFKPKPCPLCHWCDYCDHNEDADDKTKDLCEYYSLWTPTYDSFKVNRKWGEEEKPSSFADMDW